MIALLWIMLWAVVIAANLICDGICRGECDGCVYEENCPQEKNKKENE